MKKIISIHIPKTAGTSFKEILTTAYGKERVLEDYSEDPVNPVSKASMDPEVYKRNPKNDLNDIDVVHGHFHPSKYLQVENATFITFLREPIDNVISIYNFWIGLGKGFHPLHDYFVDNELSILEFVELPAIRYLYSKCYFGSFDLERMDFIGDYASYKTEISRLSKILDKQLKNDIYLNRTSSGLTSREKLEIRNDKNKMGHLTRMLKEDIQLYDHYKGR